MGAEWTREEALARVAAVEMLDLPLSEAQAQIESEFGEQGLYALEFTDFALQQEFSPRCDAVS